MTIFYLNEKRKYRVFFFFSPSYQHAPSSNTGAEIMRQGFSLSFFPSLLLIAAELNDPALGLSDCVCTLPMGSSSKVAAVFLSFSLKR